MSFLASDDTHIRNTTATLLALPEEAIALTDT